MTSIVSAAISPNRPLSRKYIPALDGFRGIAILGVLVTHAVPRLPNTGLGFWWNQVVDAGSFGVDLFFVLSGFLITGILLDSDVGPRFFLNFFARRFLRLFPVYYVYLILVATLVPAIHRAVHSSMPDYGGSWWWFVFYVCNLKPDHAVHDPYLGHFWSLAVEEQFYLIWPAVVFFLPRRWLTCFCLWAIALALALRVFLSWSGADWNTIYRVTPMRLDALALGGLGAIALRSERWRDRGIALARKALPAGSALFLCSVLLGQSTSWSAVPIQTWGITCLTAAFASIVYLAANTDSGIARVFSARWLRMFGKYSYTIYVVHVLVASHVFFVAAAFSRRIGPLPYWAELMCSGIVITLSYAVAAVSWKYFEKPLLQFKEYFGSPSVT